MIDITLIAYGAAIQSDVDLSTQVIGGGAYRCELRLVKSGHELNRKALLVSGQLPEIHGREICLSGEDSLENAASGVRRALEVPGVVSFWWSAGEATVHYTLAEEGPLSQLAFWFVQVFLPLYLSIEEGFDFLHAGAVEVFGKTILFIAPSTGGKSTLAEYFVGQKHQLVSDDKLSTYMENKQFMAMPAQLAYRPHGPVEHARFRTSDYAREPSAIAAIYVLNRVGAEDEIHTREVTGMGKFRCLMPNYVFGFPHMRARRMKYLASLVNRVPVLEVDVPHDLERLGEVYEGIIDRTQMII